MLTPTPDRNLDYLGAAELRGGICVQTNVGEPQTGRHCMAQGSLVGKPIWAGRQRDSLVKLTRSSTTGSTLRGCQVREPSQSRDATRDPLSFVADLSGFGVSFSFNC